MATLDEPKASGKPSPVPVKVVAALTPVTSTGMYTEPSRPTPAW